ncbi:MAG: beta-glucosidase [Cytophagales bacterium]|nr:MAG: beta-glucosidase [Cytophagales bacterium]
MKKTSPSIAFCFLSVLLLFSCKPSSQKTSLEAYLDANQPIEIRVEDLLKKMTLEEKINQLNGHGLLTDTNARLGIPAFYMSDGSVGVRTGKATAFPASTALAASWDTTLIYKVGKAMGEEMIGKGLNYYLSPCVNLYRIPNGGRNFESYGEDPVLTAALGVAYIKGVQSKNVIACVKHFVCNEQEWERRNANSEVDERTLRELYFVPFKAVIDEAKVMSIMASYNLLNGTYTSEHEWLLNTVLKKEWGYTGHVVSDWDATHSTAKSANSGLDLEMPQPTFFGTKLLAAVKAGEVKESQIDDMVRRILRTKFQFGLFEHPPKLDSSLVSSENTKQIALEAAQKGIVLLKNESSILPLDIQKIKSIAVIGPNAKFARTGGGGSAFVIPSYVSNPLEEISNKVGNSIKINYALGDVLDKKEANIIGTEYLFTDGDRKQAGLKAEYFNNMNLEGKPVLERIDPKVDFVYNDGSPDPKINNDGFSARWTGVLVSPVPRKYVIYTLADDGVRLYINDKLVFENWDVHGTEKDSVEIFLDQNKLHKIKLEYFDGQMGANVKLGWDFGDEPIKTSNANISEAVLQAKKSDIAILFVGLSSQYETEGKDTPEDLLLPNNQNELIKAVSAVNPNTIVILNGTVAFDISSWSSKVKGIIDMFYLGSETGKAITNVLFGDYNPSGKIPFTWMYNNKDYPTLKGYKNPNLKTPYKEGIYLGYRYYDKNKITPQFPFGFGLSFTQFSYGTPSISQDKETIQIEIEVKNSGERDGNEIVQLYIHDVESTIDRPEKELKAFTNIFIRKGETQKVTLKFKKEALAFFEPKGKKWVLEKGKFKALIGASSKDIKASIDFEL